MYFGEAPGGRVPPVSFLIKPCWPFIQLFDAGRKLWRIEQTKGSIALRASQPITRIKRPWIRFIMDCPFCKMTIFIIFIMVFQWKSFWVMSFSINCEWIIFKWGQQWAFSRPYFWLFNILEMPRFSHPFIRNRSVLL